MEVAVSNKNEKSKALQKTPRKNNNLKSLRLSLRYRPEIMNLVLNMRKCIKKKSLLIKNLKQHLKIIEEKLSESLKQTKNEGTLKNTSSRLHTQDSGNQTENLSSSMNIDNLQADNFSEYVMHCRNVVSEKNTDNRLNTKDSCIQTDDAEFPVNTDKLQVVNWSESVTQNENENLEENTLNQLNRADSSSQTDKMETYMNVDKADYLSESSMQTENEGSDKITSNRVNITDSSSQTIRIDVNKLQLDNLIESQMQTENEASVIITSIKVITKESSSQTENEATQCDNLSENKGLEKNTLNMKDSICQTNDVAVSKNIDKPQQTEASDSKEADSGWSLSQENLEGKSIADQVKEAAQSALQQTGMVYVESAGMYYDYKTGYYYNSELGLYYHTDTGCYYYYSEEKKEFAFHSYPDKSAVAKSASLEAAYERRKARKQKKAQRAEEEIEKLTKNLSKDDEEPTKAKRRKKEKKISKKDIKKDDKSDGTENNEVNSENKVPKDEDKTKDENKEDDEIKELEDGECSETASEDEKDEKSVDEESDASTATLDDDDCVAKHHPPCMRIIVRDTKLPKLKVGSLFLVTKDGGSIGREGDHHTILIRDANISRNHLEIKYDIERKMYMATDLGSKNGTLLNGIQMSQSQIASKPMEVIHGSIIQLGETKLLCHIHAGNDTCGHCEPGLIMETQEKEKVAYTRTCNVQQQYQLELARLKNKYKPEPLMIEEGSYNDRAKARREAVGSSHQAEKTLTADVETHIAPENKGFKLLQKMGWSKGEGLGKDNQGDTAPIPLVNNESKAGLGAPGSAAPPPVGPPLRVHNKLGSATLRLASKTKLLQAPAKAFQVGDDSD